MGEWAGGVTSECPAIKELKEALLAGVSWLAADSSKIGTVRDDGSRHTAGLAMDIMLDSRDIVEKSIADDIIAAVVKLHSQMRWADLIYVDWNNGKPSYFHIPGMPPFGGPKGMLKKNPTSKKLGEAHKNHIHIDWWSGNKSKWPAHASTKGFKTALIAELQGPPQWLVDYMATVP
ncbi:MAG: hypothetical protein ACT4O9_04905 [Blastocatellia bacterium]